MSSNYSKAPVCEPSQPVLVDILGSTKMHLDSCESMVSTLNERLSRIDGNPVPLSPPEKAPDTKCLQDEYVLLRERLYLLKSRLEEINERLFKQIG